LGHAELVGGFETEVAVDDLPVAADQQRDLEAEFLDGGDHAVDRLIVVAGVTGVGTKLGDVPIFDGWRRLDHGDVLRPGWRQSAQGGRGKLTGRARLWAPALDVRARELREQSSRHRR
jgi:hypothetical protein